MAKRRNASTDPENLFEDQMDQGEYQRLASIGAIQQWALRQNDPKVSPQLALIGIIVFLLFEPVGMIGTIAAAGPLAFNLWRKLNKAGSEDRWMEENQCFAHALDRTRLIQLARLTSKETVLAQLKQARLGGLKLTPAASKLAELTGITAEPEDVDAILGANFYRDSDDMQSLSDAYAPQQRLTQSPGAYTRLNAIPASVAPAGAQHEQDQGSLVKRTDGAVLDSEIEIQDGTALSRLLDNPFTSTVFFGSQRTGKSMLVAVLGRILTGKGVRVYHINLLSYTSETTDEDAVYTEHVFKTVKADISQDRRLDDPTIPNHDVNRAMKLVDEWWADPKPGVIVIDEWAYLSSEHAGKANEVVRAISAKLSAVASSGIKRNKAAYAILPIMVAGDMTKAGKSIKGLRPCYVTIAPGRWVDWQGSKITFDDQLFSQVKRNFEGISDRPDPYYLPDTDRIACINGEWLEIGATPGMLKIPFQQENPIIPDIAPTLNGSELPTEKTEEKEPVKREEWMLEVCAKVKGHLKRKGGLAPHEIKSGNAVLKILGLGQTKKLLAWMEYMNIIRNIGDLESPRYELLDTDS